MAGGLARQPIGYLNDVMRVRNYLRAREAVEREQVIDGETRFPAPDWAQALVLRVTRRLLEGGPEDGD